MKNLVVIALLLALVSCENGIFGDKIDGNGNVVEETRAVNNFTEVEISGAYEVEFIQDGENKVEVEAESNLMEYIEVYVTDGKLVIENKDNVDFRTNEDIEIVIHHSGVSDVDFSGAGSMDFGILETQTLDVNLSGAGEIDGNISASEIIFDISGSGTIECGVECTDLEAYLSGSGVFDFWGTAVNCTFDVSGAGNFNGQELSVVNSYNTISGTGDVFITVSEYLEVDISGTGNIFYWGNPVLGDLSISGSGKIVHQDN